MGKDIGNGMKLAAIGPAVGGVSVNDIVEFANGYKEGVIGIGKDLPLKCISDV